MKCTILAALLCTISFPVFAQSAPSDDLRDLITHLNAMKNSGTVVNMGGIDINKALRVEADAIWDIDQRLRTLELMLSDRLRYYEMHRRYPSEKEDK